MGTGPGSVLLEGPEAVVTDAALTSALTTPLVRGPSVTEHRGCPVVGSGPLARRLDASLGSAGPSAHTAPLRVEVHQQVVPVEAGVAIAREQACVLPVVVQPRRVVVGPLTGRASGPCLHCLDLHRTDLDPGWPGVVSELGHPMHQGVPLPVAPPLVSAAEGLVLLLVAAALDDRPPAPGITYELGSTTPHVLARRWSRHGACPWHDQPLP